MDPQIIPPPPPKNEKQQKTVKTQKTVPTIEEASKQQKSKLPNTNLEVSKVGKSPNREKPNAEEKNVDSKKTSPKELIRKGKSNKDEMAAEVGNFSFFSSKICCTAKADVRYSRSSCSFPTFPTFS
uniref:Uncharacterized protein n=1 Tax=Caenorhabditis tropicalis TaxID=1561998 RepID=A0A1I7UG23_9PELO